MVAIKKVALRKIEDGIPNTALREIKALREIEDSPYVRISFAHIFIFFYNRNYMNGGRM